MFDIGKNYKIDLSGYELEERREISEKIQRRLFDLGYKWYLDRYETVRETGGEYLFIDSDMDITWGTREHGDRELTLLPSDILTPQRGDVVEVATRKNDWYERIFLCEVEGATAPYICVSSTFDDNFRNDEPFDTVPWKHMRPVQKTYRDFTPSELVEQVGKEVSWKGTKATISAVTVNSYSQTSVKLFFTHNPSKSVDYPHRLLTFPDGSPFGVEVTV